MKQKFFFLISFILLVSCTGSDQPTAVPQPTATNPSDPTPTLAEVVPPTAVPPTAIPPTALPATEIAQPAPTAVLQPTAILPTTLTEQEAILIQEPGPGWRLTSPLHLSGMADPTFEQNLVVRLLLEDGTELALLSTTIAADNGQRGPFAIDIPFTVTGERQAFLQVYTTSARDGGITHLSSVGLTIADTGPENRPPFTPFNERIVIIEPQLNTVVSGGLVHVAGLALASFEATLLVEVYDEAGTLIGSEPILVQSPDVGLPGSFEAAIPYTIGTTGPGRVVIHDISPAFGGDVHVASVEIQFE